MKEAVVRVSNIECSEFRFSLRDDPQMDVGETPDAVVRARNDLQRDQADDRVSKELR